MPKVSEVKVGPPMANLGTFRTKMFNMFVPEEAGEYAELRTKNNDKSSGVKIDHLEQYARKTSITEDDGDGHSTVTVCDDLYMFVQWWEKTVTRTKGDSDEELNESKQEWHREGVAQPAE